MKKYIKLFGNILMAAAILFLFNRIRKMDISWSNLLGPSSIFIIALCSLLYAVMIMASFCPWMRLVGLMTQQEERIRAAAMDFARIFTKSNIMKYIPGNVFQYVGRNEIATVLSLPHIQVAGATVTEMVLMAFGAGFLSVILLGSYTFHYFYQRLGMLFYLFLTAGVILGIVLLLGLRGKVKKELESRQINYKSNALLSGICFCFVFYIMTFLYGGVLFIIVMKLCGNFILNFHSLRLLLGTYALSWVAGYITPGAPGGMGIREVIMTAVLGGSQFAADEVIVQASVLFRFVTVLGDLIAFVAAQVICSTQEGR